MRNFKRRRVSLLLLLLGAFLAPAASGADKREIIRQARKAYYNLPSQGFDGFQVAVVPDWTVTLKDELKTDIPPDHPALKILNGIHFWLAWDQNGATKLSHQVDSTPVDQKSAEGMNQTVSGVEQVLSGFSQTIAPFLFSAPFPEAESTYDLEELSDLYRISYKEGQFDIITTMRKDFAVVEMKVKGQAFAASIKPQIKSSPKGFLLSGYEGDYQPASGDAYLVSVQIDYKEVEGLQLPGELRMEATARGSTHKMDLHFTDFQVKKH